jgi:hypothetical protein
MYFLYIFSQSYFVGSEESVVPSGTEGDYVVGTHICMALA